MRTAKTIPAPILSATVALLAPFCPGIEPGALVRALRNAGRDDKATATTPGALLTVREAAARLSVSPRTAWRLISAGRIKAVRVSGRSLRVPESAIIDMPAAATERPQ